MIPRFKPNYNFEEIISIISNKDDAIKSFEENFANLIKMKYAVSFSSARCGLYALLDCLKIKDEVISSGFTCIVVPASIIASGFKPVFTDISLYDYNLKTDEIPSIFSRKTKAVIPTHMYGYLSDTKKIREMVGDDVLIIEDAAQAILTKDVGKFGDAVFYSFNFEKQIFTFGGGMIATNNKELYQKLVDYKTNFLNEKSSEKIFKKTISLIFTRLIFSDLLANFFIKMWDVNALRSWKSNKWDFYDKNLPLKDIYLSDDLKTKYLKIQAAAGLSQLKKIKNDIKRRFEIAKIYDKELKDVEKIVLPPLNNNCSYAYYTIRVENRNDFYKFMKKNSIQVNRVFEYSIPHIPYFSSFIKNIDKFKNSYIAGNSTINLPIYPQLMDNYKKISKIIEKVKEYFE